MGKVLKKNKLRRQKQIERTKTERSVLEICDHHPFIMSMYYAFQTEERLYLVLEYCAGGELFFHLSRFRKFPEHVARFYTAELVCALDFLHQNGIIYRDMKPENVLIDMDGHVKLGDFGLAKDNIWDPVSGARSICGTPEYMAPEVLNKVGHGSAVDWWGLGMLLYEMLTGLPPWYTKDRQKLFQRLRYAPLRIPTSMSLDCAGCVSALLCRNPAERLGAVKTDDIKNHDFFTKEQDFSWEALEARKIVPPINPMDGVDVGGEADKDKGAATANFDPQFTALAIWTDAEDADAENKQTSNLDAAASKGAASNRGGDAEEHFEHFEGFSFAGSGSLEVASGVEPAAADRFGTASGDDVMTGAGLAGDLSEQDEGRGAGGDDERAADLWTSPVQDSQIVPDPLVDTAISESDGCGATVKAPGDSSNITVSQASGAGSQSPVVTTSDQPIRLDDLSLQDSPPASSKSSSSSSTASASSTEIVVPVSASAFPADCTSDDAAFAAGFESHRLDEGGASLKDASTGRIDHEQPEEEASS